MCKQFESQNSTAQEFLISVLFLERVSAMFCWLSYNSSLNDIVNAF